MSAQFTLREAKARLSEILDMVAAGVPVEITRQGQKSGRFKVIPADAEFGKRKPGALKGKIRIPENFDDEDMDIIADFEGQA
ncbi:MAG: type II toxin-antitoxin system prevent-host-death family antitoxin [Pseudomonadota bacterium]